MSHTKRTLPPPTPRRGFLPLLLLASLLLVTACHQYSFSAEREGEYVWAHGPRKILVKALGEIEFTPDDSDVTRLSPDGYLMIEESLVWNSKIIEFSAGLQGQVQKRLLVDGKEQPLDAAALAWQRRLLPEVIRHTGFAAETRARRFLEAGGYPALAAEVERLGSDSVRARYFNEAIRSASLSEQEQADLLRDIGRLMGSDSRRANLLRQFSSRVRDEPLRGAFFDALDRIGSDSRRANLLRELLEANGEDAELLRRLLVSAGRIGSDSNRARLLVDAASRLPAGPLVQDAFFDAARGIGSDSNKTRVLRALLPRAAEDRELFLSLLDTSRTIGSDSNKAALLAEAAAHGALAGNAGEVREAFFRASETIGSNRGRLQVLAAVFDNPPVDAPTLTRLYRAGSSIGSDSNKADLLIRSLSSYDDGPEVRQAFFALADTISSNSNRANVFAAMLDRPSLSPETILALIQSTESIGSDSNKAEVFTRVAQRGNADPRVEQRLQQAAKTLGSDSAYRRVMSELRRGRAESPENEL
jgi:hypothetical protein